MKNHFNVSYGLDFNLIRPLIKYQVLFILYLLTIEILYSQNADKRHLTTPDSKSTTLAPAKSKKIISKKAILVVQAIQNKDFKKLSTFIHPEKGLRFSPYCFVDTTQDLVFTSKKISGIEIENGKYLWGYFDGKGDEISETFMGYYEQFIYDRYFIKAEKISYNEFQGTGNTINNIFEIYSNAITVEYYFPGFEPKYGGMDWESLILVFQKKGQIWYLVGIIHNEWTI